MAFFKAITNSINKKIFVTISIILIISSSIIYLGLIFGIPMFYRSYKEEYYEKISSEFTDEISGMNFRLTGKLFSRFIEKNKNNICYIFIFDENGKYVSIPENKYKYYVSLNDRNFLTLGIADEAYNYYNDKDGANEMGMRLSLDKKLVVVNREFFNTTDGRYTIYYTYQLQPIKETSGVLIEFIPYISIVILLISFCAARIYAKKVSKPIIEISNKSQLMSSNMDLNIRCEVDGNDEIAVLGNSLNELAESVSISLREISEKNELLRLDIEKEKIMEKKRLDFFNAASHELKTPITILRGQLEGMLFKVGVYKDRDKYLKYSIKVINRIQELIKEVYNISIVEDESIELNLKTFNASDLFKTAVGNLEEIALSRNSKISSFIEEGKFILGDEHLIGMVVSNVIKNAIVHSPKEEKIKVIFKDYVLTVENYGTSIPEEDLDKLFNPYYRVDKSRNSNSGGTGLGLYIVKEILNQHEFKFNIENGYNKVIFNIDFRRNKEVNNEEGKLK